MSGWRMHREKRVKREAHVARAKVEQRPGQHPLASSPRVWAETAVCANSTRLTLTTHSRFLSLFSSLSSLRLDTRVNLFHASGLVRQRIPRHATAASRAVQVSPLLCRCPRLAARLSLPACDSDDTRATPRNHRQLESGSHLSLCRRVLPTRSSLVTT